MVSFYVLSSRGFKVSIVLLNKTILHCVLSLNEMLRLQKTNIVIGMKYKCNAEDGLNPTFKLLTAALFL